MHKIQIKEFPNKKKNDGHDHQKEFTTKTKEFSSTKILHKIKAK